MTNVLEAVKVRCVASSPLRVRFASCGGCNRDCAPEPPRLPEDSSWLEPGEIRL